MHHRFSHTMQTLRAAGCDRPLTLGDILNYTAERGFALMIGLLVTPFLLPMPPGLSAVLGAVCLLLSGQMLLGCQRPWLPQRIARICISHALLDQGLQKLHWIAIKLENVAKPRWGALIRQGNTGRVNGLCLGWLTLLLMAPIPFTNPIPATLILLLVIGIIESDGLLMSMSYFLTGLITAGLGAMGYTLWRSPEWFSQLLLQFSE